MKKENKVKMTAIRMEESLYKKVVAQAEKEERTVSFMIRLLCIRALNAMEEEK